MFWGFRFRVLRLGISGFRVQDMVHTNLYKNDPMLVSRHQTFACFAQHKQLAKP